MNGIALVFCLHRGYRRDYQSPDVIDEVSRSSISPQNFNKKRELEPIDIIASTFLRNIVSTSSSISTSASFGRRAIAFMIH